MRATSPIVSVTGVLQQFTLSPKGVPEGLIIQPARTLAKSGPKPALCQVNFDPELAGQVTTLVKEGDSMTVHVVPFRDAVATDHSVYDLVQLTAADGKTLVAEGPAELEVTVKGIVQRLNYAKRGEVNGAVLDAGDFVHLRPHGAKMVEVRIGQTLEVSGEVRGGWSGRRVVEARSVNGKDIPKPPKPGGKPPHPHEPHHGHNHPPHHKHPKPRPHHPV